MHLKSIRITQALIIITLLMSFSAFSQAPNLLNYQGVARNTVGNPLPNQTMKLRLSVHDLLPSGAIVYSEIRQITTNLGGLFSVQIGSAGASSSTGTIAGVNWLVGDKFLQVELDPASNNNYLDIGTVQLVSVPYSFAAGSAATVKTNANLTGVVTSVGNATSIANGAITSDMIGTLNKSKVGLDLVNNTSDASKPISDLTQAALDLKLNTTGNAATATKLATARNINGVAFDGSGDITITSTADAGSLTGTTLKSTVTGSSLTSVGTLANLTVTNPIAGSITGNAATATTAGNITATSNSTITSLPNLVTVGTISSGTISLTTDIKTSGTFKAGTITYPNVDGTSGQVLSTTGSGTLTWTNVSGGSSGVPYTGATGAVNLGAYDLTVNGLKIGKGGGSIANNTSFGNASLGLNTTGTANSAAGFESLKSNTTGAANTAFGAYALRENLNGERNTAVGSQALQLTNGAYDNTAVGYLSSVANASGSHNTAVGSNSSLSNTAGSDNTSVGYEALYLNQANGNTSSGYQSMRQNIGGGRNTALGYTALYSNTTASYNVAVGAQALGGTTTGERNVAIGAGALDANVTGSYNTVLGGFAGRYIANGSSAALDGASDGASSNTRMDNSILIGAWTKPKANNETNQIVIGYNAIGNGSNTIQLGNTGITNVKTSGTLTAGAVTYPNTNGITGQVLSATASGTITWTTVSSGSGGSGVHYLGEAFNGGIIYYLYKGSDGLEHGLIVAPTESIADWQTSPSSFVNAIRTEDGAYNTALMTGSPAVTYIQSLGAGWYLPSIDELGLLYYNRYHAQKGLRDGGQVLLSNTSNYWSSMDYDASYAYYFNFNTGSAGRGPKINVNRYSVRGVRAF